MNESYKTIEAFGQDELIEKKSRFIGYALPVKSEDEALSFISKIKTTHYDATHNVFAYIIKDTNTERFSDDGEPSGTAGIPILEYLKKEELTDICVVVTRYFGGTLLGAGGLIRTYGKAAKLGVEAANIIRMVYCELFSVSCEYTLLGKVQYEINQLGHKIEDTTYDTGVTFTVCVESSQSCAFKDRIVEATNALATVTKIGERFVPYFV